MSSARSPDGSAPRDHGRRGVVAASSPSSKHPTQKNQTPAAVSSSLDTIDVLCRSRKIVPRPALTGYLGE